jgi:hypothetical protein
MGDKTALLLPYQLYLVKLHTGFRKNFLPVDGGFAMQNPRLIDLFFALTAVDGKIEEGRRPKK